MLSTRDAPQNKRSTQIETEGMEKNVPSQKTRKERWSSNTYIRQNRLQNKGHKKRQRRTIHNTQGRFNQEDINIVNICAPNIGAPKYIRKILEDFKKDINSNTFILGDFNIPSQQ